MSHRKRLIFVAVLIFAWAGLILSRLFILQYERHEEFAERAEQQYRSKITLDPKRGTIYDRDGRILAINVDVPSCYAVPRDIADPQKVADALAPVLDMDRKRLLRLLDRDSSFVWLARKISFEQRNTVEALDFDGISFVTESKRMYPGGNLAGHALGFVGIDNQGLAGVEFSYDLYLRGREGLMLGLRGAKRGYLFSAGKVVKEPTGGNDLQLTLDARTQFIVEQELKRQVEATQSESGTVVAINPNTGAILALANYPDYDPNDYGSATAFSRKNRAVVDAYEPGSTFKLVTAAAALEAGVVSEEDQFDCQMGSIQIGSRTIRDHHPFGVLTFREIIERSSNVGMIKVAQRLGSQRLWQMARNWGYGDGTGIDLPGENKGILRDVERWSANSYGSIAIGQEVSGSPVQILMNIAVIANGGNMVKPYIVESVIDDIGRKVYQAAPRQEKIVGDSTIQRLRSLTRGVVVNGGGGAARVVGISVGGKTGTGEIAAPGRGYLPGAYLSSFAGYFPVEAPEIAMICMLVKPKGKFYGSEVAAPLFGAIASRIVTEMGIVRENQRRVAAGPAFDAGMTQPVSDPHVIHQPRVVPDFTETLLMPDVRGMSLRDAVSRLAGLGLVPRVEGSGTVTAQRPLPGQPVRGKPSIQCYGTGVAN